MTLKTAKYPYIDALRGLAILGVMAVHAGQWVTPSSSWLLKLSEQGARGVQLFYVLSAITLYLSMKKRMGVEPHATRNFFIRRFFRIAPLFYLALAVGVLVDGMGPRYWAPSGVSGRDVILSGLFLNGFYPAGINAVLPGGWSIAVEMSFYALFPLLFLKVKSPVRMLQLALLSALAARYLNPRVEHLWQLNLPPEQAYLATDYVFLWIVNQLPVFLMGMLAAILATRDKPLSSAENRAMAVSSLVFVALLAIGITWHPGRPLNLGAYAAGFASCVLFWVLKNRSLPLLVNPFTRFIGVISFSLYLGHFFVVEALKKGLLWAPAFSGGSDLGFLGAYAWQLFCASGLAWLTYHAVEKPGLALADQLIKWLK